MFVHLGGDENSKPTYFEVIAADRLVPSLKAAIVYTLSVLLPYVRAKLDKAYRRASGTSGVLGLALRYGALQGSTDLDAASRSGSDSEPRLRLSQLAVAAYPWLHAALEAIGVRMARTSAQDLMAADKAKQDRRQAALGALAAGAGGASGAGSRVRSALLRRLLGARWLVEDHARTALILAVFGFKALEWWYTTAEDSLAKGKALPPPPPPPPPRPVPPPAGVGLPADPSECPICRKRTTNPATVATSGYVFCYPCVFSHVMQHGRCPVSHIAATLDHIRKIYEAA
ncbi:hypothetical protein GPECTOR_10g858 [Gonium pectorale]|uniref:Peroxin-12 n=1 Tax=Gonium pectorale TaxID=33097 RepID=A0A150GQZ5_GONPE|nr:hypothetical protein GPECTOR_10g858 [Gonium pectorale]|eukprot:KXZ52227.1 hypothetical protein GPECTOR_10g858 [Gonium pectorale]